MRRFLRRLRRRLDDWRSDSRVAFGGPLDGQRLRVSREMVTPMGRVLSRRVEQYYVNIWGAVYWLHVPVYCEGAYELIGERFCWTQWSAVVVPPSEEGP